MEKKNITKIAYTNEEPYFITIKVGNHQTYIIGGYFKKELRMKILKSIQNFINRIRKTAFDANIIRFGDLNPDRYFKLEDVEKQPSLNTSCENKNLITRSQKFKNKVNESWLDYWLSNRRILETTSLESFKSEHYPLKYIIEVPIGSKKKKNIVIKRTNFDTSKASKILKDSNWPDIQIKNKILWVKKLIIRSSIKINKNIKNKFSKKINWEEKELNLRNLNNESFKNYEKDLDLNLIKAKQKFFQIKKSLLKFSKEKIVKGIKLGDQILLGSEMEKVVEKHFNNLFNIKIRKWEETNFTQNNQIEDIHLNWEEGIRNLSQGKARGLDGVPSEILKLKNKNSK